VNDHIYLHEIIRTVPGREEPYLASVASVHHDPTRADRSPDANTAFGQFRSVDSSGAWPCGINIWEHDWAGQTENLVAQFQDARRDVSMEEWWNRNLHLRRGGYDRLLLPADYSPTRAEVRERGITGEIFVHEILWLPFGEPARYLDRLAAELLPALDDHGLDLVGAFRVAMRPRQVVTLIGASEWSRLGTLFDAAAREPRLSSWLEYRASCVERADELMLIPARHDALARGR
jgi:hypothetical protein